MSAAINRDAEAVEREFDRLDERNGGPKRHAIERLPHHAQGYEAKGRDDLAAELRRITANIENGTPGGESSSRHEFDQCAAEAKVMLGEELAVALLTRAGKRFGWPIPPQHRVRVAALLGFALSRRGDEGERGDVQHRKR